MDPLSPGAPRREKRRATLRHRVASLTETARRAVFQRHGRRAGEGAP
ncbi:DUF6380 family protein [Streptomyces sp. NPDC005931]